MVVTQSQVSKSIKEFFGQFRLKKIAQGTIFNYSGNPPPGVYFIEKGSVRQYIISKEGKELTLHIYHPGAFIPLTWGINDIVPDFNLQALNQVSLRIAPKEEFTAWLKHQPEVLYSLVTRLVDGLSGLTKRIEVNSLQNADEIIISILKYLASHYGKQSHNKETKICLKFTHEDISALTGLSRERVTIEMKKMKNKNLVNYTRGKITIKSLKDLNNYSSKIKGI